MAFELKDFMQTMLAHFLALKHYEYKCPSIRKDMSNKIRVMQQSCSKVEQLCLRLTLQNLEQIFSPIDASSLTDGFADSGDFDAAYD
ncbi:hypothetical protein D3C80_2016750 [compost metagenome]